MLVVGKIFKFWSQILTHKKLLSALRTGKVQTPVPIKSFLYPIKFVEAITSAGINSKNDTLTKIHLFLNGNVSSLLLEIFCRTQHQKFISKMRLIRIERLKYKPSKVFITGSGITPRIFNISIQQRDTGRRFIYRKRGSFFKFCQKIGGLSVER